MKGRGFTLLELLIVLVIIALLFAIALPIYQDYIVKANVGAVNAEVGALKTAFDICVNDGRLTPQTCDLGATASQYQVTGGNSQAGGAPANGGVPTMVMAPDGSGSITATFGGRSSPRLAAVSASLGYVRDASGNWSCQLTSIDAKFAPTGCKVSGP